VAHALGTSLCLIDDLAVFHLNYMFWGDSFPC
jgi:hypothetical protein